MKEYGTDLKLEKLADQLLKEDAKHTIDPETGLTYIKPNKRGYTKYATDHGIITKKHDERYHKTEMTGLDIEYHSQRKLGEGHSKRYDEPDDSMER